MFGVRSNVWTQLKLDLCCCYHCPQCVSSCGVFILLYHIICVSVVFQVSPVREMPVPSSNVPPEFPRPPSAAFTPMPFPPVPPPFMVSFHCLHIAVID